MTSVVYKYYLLRNEDLQMTFGVGHYTTLIVNILFKTSIFQRICKKNNQSSVSDADREIPILGSTDNAGNSVKLVSGIIRLPSGWDVSVCIGDQCLLFCLPVTLRIIDNHFSSLWHFTSNNGHLRTSFSVFRTADKWRHF